MTQQPSRNFHVLSMIAATVLLLIAGFVWSLPPGGFMLVASGALSLASIVALLFVNHFAASFDKEVVRLSGELERKTAQVLVLAEAEREDDRIVESLSEKVHQLKNTVLALQTKHVSERQRIPAPDLALQAAIGNVVPINSARSTESPRLCSLKEFQTVAAQCARIAARYDRYFTVIRVTMDVGERSRQVGPAQARDECKVAVEAIARTLRTSDFASAEASDSILIAYPETSDVHVDAIMNRIRSALNSSIARDLRIELDPRSAVAV